jgi:serine/threonine protein phosphatase PrpC
VAEFAKNHLPNELLETAEYREGKYEKALMQAFLKIDVLLDSEAGRSEIAKITADQGANKGMSSPTKKGLGVLDDDTPDMKGCTANVMLIKNKTMYVANAGDSRAVLCHRGKAMELSFDHKPDNEGESRRITKAGGSVIEGRVDGNLNLSRALGDLRYKTNKSLKPEEQMITSFPEITKKTINSDCEYVVMGCDGVYETKTSQEIVDFFSKEFKSAPHAPLKHAIAKYLDDVLSPDYIKTEGAGCDNMTCIIIKFKNPK